MRAVCSVCVSAATVHVHAQCELGLNHRQYIRHVSGIIWHSQRTEGRVKCEVTSTSKSGYMVLTSEKEGMSSLSWHHLLSRLSISGSWVREGWINRRISVQSLALTQRTEPKRKGLIYQSRRKSKDRPRTHWRDYISNSWSRNAVGFSQMSWRR